MNKKMDGLTKVSLIVLCICTVVVMLSNQKIVVLPDIARIIVCIVQMIMIITLVYSLMKNRRMDQ